MVCRRHTAQSRIATPGWGIFVSRWTPRTRATTAALITAASAWLVGDSNAAEPAGSWAGTATCSLTTTGPYEYSDRQVHTWTIAPGAAQMQNGAARLYTYDWAETGNGRRAGSVSWSINGRGAGKIAFRTNTLNGILYIGIQQAAGRDNSGITVTDATGGKTKTYPAPAYEW